jgi:hypothetical protein
MFPFDQANQPMYQQYAQAYDSGQSGRLDHGQLLGPGGVMSSPIARMALTGIAGLAAKQMMGQGAAFRP